MGGPPKVSLNVTVTFVSLTGIVAVVTTVLNQADNTCPGNLANDKAITASTFRVQALGASSYQVLQQSSCAL